MNREIKFRAWRENKMHYNITTAHYEHNAMSGSSGDLWDFAEWMKWSKVMQYTGMKDKNAKEIYEGDILKIQGYRGAVHHVQVKWESVDASDDMGMDMIGFPRYSQYGEPEVVGNIFENPELLEK